MITKTDLERLAKALGTGASQARWAARSTAPYPASFVTSIISRVADELADNNPNFNRAKFYARVTEYATNE